MLIAVVDKLIVILFLFLTLNTLFVSSTGESSEETILEDFVICRQCGTDVSLSNFLINKPAASTLDSNNITLFNKTSVLVQQLENPAGVRFQIVTVNIAFCAKIYTQWRDSYSWFPGYAWKLCLCPKCSTHIGWMFEPVATATDTQILPTEKGFYGIIVSNVLTESFVNSLLMTEHHHSKDTS
ncbi:protein cereblon homolog [Bradysia coprophila]|uniref:protein cereblon homolog n=1 Tax=Bradysia coprophila TaxID=38358 RepID=UPI00187DC36F|nr:protein cereblon homolog [Bradysia coprophila]